MNLTASIVVLSTVGLVIACGGKSEQSLDEYFDGLEKAVDGFIADTDAVAMEHGFLVNFDDVPGTVAGFQTFLPAMIEAAEEFAGKLDTLRPPPEATESHAASVTALEEFVAAAGSALDELPGIRSSETLSATYERYADSGIRFSQTCKELQRVANEHGVDADLRCAS